ncbi:mycofactocin-coupled SDR family oxidoreductase [Mycolicibacterium palauense]|uniref:mycofactocin-coupled SDR family oxidoreductase n=1 Tax=Mycolicibacterium palauense TaxID=2034511 RepID=UPI000BFEFA45|nr:mycofactocin-coupled SDR family oxidoreductase [Mycolicibacterium palauense]
MGKLDGKVALITGAARGQGRSHALTLAREGADIVAVDLVGQIDSVPYPMSRPDDLSETVKLVEELDRRILAREGDVRNPDSMNTLVADAIDQFGHIDIVCANAGIAGLGDALSMTPKQWTDMVDVNLSGVWFSIQPALKPMIERGAGGSIIITSSLYGVKAPPGNLAHYTAAKHGVVGLMRALSVELAPHFIRVNTINPTFVQTDMMQNDSMISVFVPDKDNPTQEEFEAAMQQINVMPVPWMPPADVSKTVLYLASDDSRFVTGTTALIDLGARQIS